MGVDVVVGGATPAGLAAVRALFEEWEQAFSRFRPESELNRVNAHPTPAVAVSGLFARAVRTAAAAARATGGLVDPTLGLAVEAAGYVDDLDRLRDDPRPPGPTAPGAWRTVTVGGGVLLRPPGVRLDLNGVVKALAVDEALALLGGDGFVAAGGDVATRGPVVAGLPAGGSIRLAAGGLATSGTTRRRWRRAGGTQHHLIDPRTGRPSRSRWLEVSVAAGSCLAADVAAKAAFLLSDDGPGWLDERGLPGRFVGDGELVVNRAWHETEAAAA
jgi:thiamine biosynthesis lipoprotein